MNNYTLEDFVKFIPDYVISIAEDLQKNGFQAFLVGGSIRDILLGVTPDDYDIATNALPEEIQKIFEKAIPTGAKFGTITVVVKNAEGENFDVQLTTYRSEADYFGGRWPSKVEYAKTIKEDLSRRDFTINAIALNLQSFDEQNVKVESLLIDPFGGLFDLKSGLIKAVGNPIERFTEDGLRAVRACRLCAQLDTEDKRNVEFKIEEQTFKAMQETNHITKMVSVERFRDELLKLLKKAAKPSKGLMLMKDSGILELFIPELLEGINITQPNFHIDDVFTHILKTVDEAEDSVKLAALFHDIAKPRCISTDDKGVHFYGHDIKGSEMTTEIMKRLKFSNDEIKRVSNLVRWHMFYYPSADWRKFNKDLVEVQKVKPRDALYGWTDSAIRRFIKNAGGEDMVDLLMKLRIADAKANPKSEFNPVELDFLSKRIAEVRAQDMALKISDLDIKGGELIEALKIPGSPKIREIMEFLLDKVIEDPFLNKKETLLSIAVEFVNNPPKSD